jgi:predicted nucleotidyltransferase
MRRFANIHGNADRVARHYLHLGEKQRNSYFADGKPIRLKKIFYALRPAAALRWLARHEAVVAPMHFPTLLDQCDPPTDVRAIVADLIARKAVTRELGEATLPPAIRDFVDREFAEARRRLPARAAPPAKAAKEEAEALFRAWVRRLD